MPASWDPNSRSLRTATTANFSLICLALIFLVWGDVAVAEKVKPPVMFVSIPWRGHVNPLQAIAENLSAKGYAISFALPDVPYTHRQKPLPLWNPTLPTSFLSNIYLQHPTSNHSWSILCNRQFNCVLEQECKNWVQSDAFDFVPVGSCKNIRRTAETHNYTKVVDLHKYSPLSSLVSPCFIYLPAFLCKTPHPIWKKDLNSPE